MDRVLFGLECWIYDGLEEYLLSLPGVIEVIISDKTTFFVDIKYASNITSSKLLKLETYFYLNILRIPSIVSFDKYSSVKTKEYHIVIKDICCEFCFRGIIEDLFEIDGIEKVASTFHEYNKKENVIIKIDYNPAMIKEKELKALELKWNA